MNTSLTKHAAVRMAQRAISGDMLDLVVLIGTEVDDGYVVLDRDCEALERLLKQLLQQVRRLRGVRVVLTDGCVITAYHSGQSKLRGLLRSAEDRTLKKAA